ncbi:MAG: hypothetical protein WC007_14005 [Pelobacteraceae bacterium]
MSSLIFYTDETQALIATDTLATSDKICGAPFKFTTKAFIIPHLRTVIAGIGQGGFCGRWFVHINDWMVANEINSLNIHAPHSLALLWSSYKKEFTIPDHATVKIFHFGFSEENMLINSYLYSSVKNFESEAIPYGLFGKPEFNVHVSSELDKPPKDFKFMMDSQRELQSSEAKENRVYIGGEIQLIRLDKNGFAVSYPGKFDDYSADEAAIYQNYSNNA